jgi:ABC-type phosphate/phosphonate transport system substrate-binding protein
MRTGTSRGLAGAAAALGFVICLGPADAGGGEANAPSTVRIGMIGTLFKDTPITLLEPMTRPFKSLMESQTGVKGQMIVAKDCDDLRQKLEDEQVEFGVFNGFEYAWARQKHPKLKPLVIAINQHRHLKACVVVHKDNKAAGLADLRGKSVALPRFSREHCHLFVERRCQDCGGCPKTFFAELSKPQDAEAALDQVAEGTIQAAVVDKPALDQYQRLKPDWFSELKVAQESEAFPATVITYVEGTIDPRTLKRFREGLIKANQTRTGKQVLGMCRITAFEEVPADYEQMLSSILKAYPPRDASK